MRVPGPEPTSMTLDVLLRSGAASAIWSSLYSTTGDSYFLAVDAAKYACEDSRVEETGGNWLD